MSVKYIKRLRSTLTSFKDKRRLSNCKPQKCAFFTSAVNFLWHINRPRHWKIISYMSDATHNLKRGTVLSEFAFFQDYGTYFGVSFSTLPGSRCVSTKRSEKNHHDLGSWFQKIIQLRNPFNDKLIRQPVLAGPRYDGNYTLNTEAYNA